MDGGGRAMCGVMGFGKDLCSPNKLKWMTSRLLSSADARCRFATWNLWLNIAAPVELTSWSSFRRPEGGRTARILTVGACIMPSETAKVEVTCPNCSKHLRLPVGQSGTVKCPNCNNTFRTDPRGPTRWLLY